MTDTASATRSGKVPVGLPIRLPDALAGPVEAAVRRAVDDGWAERIWARDPGVWTDDPQVAARIGERLGWLAAPESFADRVTPLQAFAQGVIAEGFERAVVCGMGGSSLAPEVLAHAFPRGEQGIPVSVLDSTDPQAVRAVTAAADPARTLLLIASKSGTTTETLAFLAHFWELQDRLHHRIPDSVPGQHFVAITDPGRSLDAIPHTDAFREVFLNPADVGGRYSALTYVGLVPGALLGLDLDELLRDARLMADRCRAPDASNPGLVLGASMAALAQAGRDKLTFVIEPALAGLGAWLEQLIAESTGKQGTGIVPVDGEPLGAPPVYGGDRAFVRIGRGSPTEWRVGTDAALETLAEAGHPVIDLVLRDGEWLGGQFFLWEFATAIAGAALGIDPFDEPNVTESKENTRRVLDRYRAEGTLPEVAPLASEGPLRLYGDAPLRLSEPGGGVHRELARHLERLRPAGYVAIQAYIAPSAQRTAVLRDLQRALRDRTGRATTMGYGPRYLHSTGQLHKGGPPSGCFIQLTARHLDDLPIPGRRESFGVLMDAQALGDLASLEAHELPVLRVDLSDQPDSGLEALLDAVERSA